MAFLEAFPHARFRMDVVLYKGMESTASDSMACCMCGDSLVESSSGLGLSMRAVLSLGGIKTETVVDNNHMLYWEPPNILQLSNLHPLCGKPIRFTALKDAPVNRICGVVGKGRENRILALVPDQNFRQTILFTTPT